MEFARALEGAIEYRKSWLLDAGLRVLPTVLRTRPALVIASSPPMASALCGTWAATLARAPLVLDFRDPWFLFDEPEHRETVPIGRSRLVGRLEDALARLCVRRSQALVVASPGIGHHLVATLGADPARIHVVPNGNDGPPLTDPVGTERSLRVLYCGSLYWNRDPFKALTSVERLVGRDDVDRKRVHVEFVGNCRQWNSIDLGDWLSERGLDDVVSLHDFEPAAAVRRRIANANLLLNLAQGQSRQVPAKSYEYVVSGRPSLVLTEHDSDVARLFEDSGTGTVVAPGDIDAMERVLLERYRVVTGEASVPRIEPRGGAHRYSRDAALERFESVVAQVLERC